MFPEIKPGTTDNTAGWTCAICGWWVAVGKTHYCTNVQPTTFDLTGDPIGTIELRQKLDNMEDLLKRIVRKMGA